MGSRVAISKIFRFTCTNPDGSVAWVEEVRNITPNETLNAMLAVFWTGFTSPMAWYMLLVDNAGFTAFAAADTAAQIGGSNGWAEFTTYSEIVRQTVVWGGVSGESVDNSASPCSFTISTGGTLKGGALVTSATKSGTGGILGAEAAFMTTHVVTIGQVIMVQVTNTMASI